MPSLNPSKIGKKHSILLKSKIIENRTKSPDDF